MDETLIKCSFCKDFLPTNLFHKMNRVGRDRKYQYSCKKCMNSYEKERCKVDPEFKAKRLLKGQNHRKNNPEYYAMKTAETKAIKGRYKLTEDQVERIRVIYHACAEVNKIGLKRYEVDHIIPLRGKTVTGLHVPSNLRIIEAEKNREKSNAYDDWSVIVGDPTKLLGD